jgi:anaerobic selenocysteine-containing dehydrogenase
VAEKIVRTICQGCMSDCGVLVHVEDGKITKIRGNPDDPNTDGALCVKGVTYGELVYHPDRVLYPLKRVGERGGGKWERISWAQALDEIAAKLKEIIEQHGPETIVLGWGTYPKNGVIPYLMFLKAINSPQAFTLDSHYCWTPHIMADSMTYGEIVKSEQVATDFRDSRCVVLWGHNPLASFPPKAWRILQGKAKGSKLIVIDPRRHQLAAKADLWLRVKPATDDALALGWLNVIIKEGLYDRSFVENWTNAPFLIRTDIGRSLREAEIKAGGSRDNFVVWDAKSNAAAVYDSSTMGYKAADVKPALTGAYKVRLANGEEVTCETVWQRLMAKVEEYPPERVEEITWVPKEQVIEAARMYATSKPAALMTHMGIAMNANSIQTSRALSILITITGNLDVKGGNVFARYPAAGYLEFRKNLRCPPEVEEKTIGAAEFPLLAGPKSSRSKPHPPTFFKLMEKGWVKAFWTSSNAAINFEDSLRTIEALKKLELFIVVDFFKTPTSDLADYLLPPATWLECDCIADGQNLPNYIAARQKAIEPLGECRDEFDMIFDLLDTMGVEPPVPAKNYKELLDFRLKKLNMTFEQFKQVGYVAEPKVEKKYEQGLMHPDGKPGFDTPSRKCEIWSSILEDNGYQPLPYYEQKYPSSDVLRDYPLILTDGRHIAIYHGQGLNLPSRRKMVPQPGIEIHPETAKTLGIDEGDWVWIETYQSKERFKRRVKLAPNLHSKVVWANSHYYYPEKTDFRDKLEPVINLAHTMEAPYDPIIGATYIRGVPCKIYKA